MSEAAPQSLLYRCSRLLCACGYALFSVGFLLWFAGLASALGGAGQGANLACLLGAWVGGLGAVAALASVVLAAWGWYTTGRPYPWWLIIAFGIAFSLLVATLYGLYLD